MTVNVLEDLKKRTTHLFVAMFSVGFACCLCAVELIVLSTKPLDHFCYLKVSEAFTAHILVVVLFTTCFLAPVLGFHCWGVFSPGIGQSRRPRLFFASVIGVASALVPLGLCQTWCNVLIGFFLRFSQSEQSLVLQYLPTINAFLWFKLKIAGCLFVALGFAFFWGQLSSGRAEPGLQSQALQPAAAIIAPEPRPFRWPLGATVASFGLNEAEAAIAARGASRREKRSDNIAREAARLTDRQPLCPVQKKPHADPDSQRAWRSCPRAASPLRSIPYTVAVLFGAFLGPGFAQVILGLLMIFLYELTLSISYIRLSRMAQVALKLPTT